MAHNITIINVLCGLVVIFFHLKRRPHLCFVKLEWTTIFPWVGVKGQSIRFQNMDAHHENMVDFSCFRPLREPHWWGIMFAPWGGIARFLVEAGHA